MRVFRMVWKMRSRYYQQVKGDAMRVVSVEQLCEIHNQIRTGRLTGDVLQRVIDNPDRYREDIGRFGRIHNLTVNDDAGLDKLVVENKFNWANESVTSKNFPTERRGTRDVAFELYEFDEVVTGEDAKKRIEADGYQNEDLIALLTFGKKFPIEQLRRPIVALAFSWRDPGGDLYVPCLDGNDEERGLDLFWFGLDFFPTYRFLVSRK